MTAHTDRRQLAAMLHAIETKDPAAFAALRTLVQHVFDQMRPAPRRPAPTRRFLLVR